jgi:SagB-type dehydrogenase family enzyme
MKGIGSQFMAKTCPQHLPPSQQRQGLPQPPLEIAPFDELPIIDIPAPTSLDFPAMDLRQAIEQRRTSRSYNSEPVTINELSLILWLTQGVKEVTSRPATLRTVPSAGSRHAFETYMAINRVNGLPPGLYRFIAIEHKLQEIKRDPDFAARLSEACGNQKHVISSAVTFIWVAVRSRMYWRYGERGYRYLHLDAGHVCQNLYLVAQAMHSGTCAIAAFDDDSLNNLLELDGVEQFAIYLASFGKRD